MDVFKSIWIRLTPTEKLNQECKKLERVFFEFYYRWSYIMGLSSQETNIFYNIYNGIVILNMYMFILGELLLLYTDATSVNDIIDNIHVTLIHFIAVFRYKNMQSNKALYKTLASSMQAPYFDLSTKERREMVQYWSRTNARYLQLLLILGTSTVAVWLVYPLVDDVPYNLAVALYLPYDYKKPILYPITYAITFLSFIFVAGYVIGNDIVMQVYLIHLLCQYRVLANCFENILADCMPRGFLGTRRLFKSDKFKTKYIRRFDCLVNQHKFILENTMNLKKTLQFPMFYQLASSGLLICFAGYQVTLAVKLSKTKFIMSVLYLGYNVFELFVFCRWCDDIRIQSENIANAVYFSKWERGTGTIPGVKFRMMLVSARAQKKLAFSAAGFSDLSLVTFTTLVKTSYSALTVLLRFQD